MAGGISTKAHAEQRRKQRLLIKKALEAGNKAKKLLDIAWEGVPGKDCTPFKNLYKDACVIIAIEAQEEFDKCLSSLNSLAETLKSRTSKKL